MKLLVTGGLGFIGSNFIRYHLRNFPDDLIVNLDCQTYASNPIAMSDLGELHNYRLVIGDICDERTVFDLTKGIDAVIHFAAETHVDRSILDPEKFALTNIIGTLNLLRAVRKNNVHRFHHVSTDEVFGSLDLDSKEKFSETTRYNPRNPYSVSKAASDFYVQAFHETYGLETTITNCSNNFGPYQHHEKLIPKSILNFLQDKPTPIYGDGKNVRDWLYVEDHCSAVELVLRNGKPGESYCISANNEFSNLQIIKMLLDIMGKGDRGQRDLIEFIPDRLGHDRRYALDSSKIRREIKWNPKYEFRESLVKTVEWYTRYQKLLHDS